MTPATGSSLQRAATKVARLDDQEFALAYLRNCQVTDINLIDWARDDGTEQEAGPSSKPVVLTHKVTARMLNFDLTLEELWPDYGGFLMVGNQAKPIGLIVIDPPFGFKKHSASCDKVTTSFSLFITFLYIELLSFRRLGTTETCVPRLL